MAALASGALIGGTTGTGEHVAFTPKTVTVGEGDEFATVTVARDACENPAFVLRFDAPRTSTNDRGSATEGEDYRMVEHEDRWESCAPGSGTATQVFQVPIEDDAEQEDAETINMSLRAKRTSTNQTLLPDVDPDGTIVIEDDDTPTQTTPTQTTTNEQPPPPAQNQPPAATQPLVTTPPPVTTPRQAASTTRACTSRRRFTLTLDGLRSASVRVGGDRMRVRRAKTGKLVATIDLRGERKGAYTVKIAGRDAKGRSVAKIRRYRTCAPR